MAQRRGSKKQAGVIAIHRDRLCLVSSRNGQRWTLPKGRLEKGMKPWEVAGMEAWEEAGLEGRVNTALLGSYRYAKQGRLWEVDLFLMEVTRVRATWPEDHRRKRRWVDPRMVDDWVAYPGVVGAVEAVFGWRVGREAG